MLTILGLAAAAGSLALLSSVFDISIWAMNFALMFALALGIDYALFLVVRFRAAHFGGHADSRRAVAETMDTAGKAVLFSGLTVLVSLSAVMLVPSPAFRSMAAGIMLAVVFVLAATLTLLPAVLGKLGDRVDALALPWVHAGEHRSARFAAWAERLWRRPVAYGLLALALLVALALPVLGMRTGMPSIAVVPNSDPSYIGYQQVQQAFGPGAPGMLQVVGPAGAATTARDVLAADPGIAAVLPAQPSADGRSVLIQAMPASDPSAKALGTTVDRLRTELPPAVQVGGAAAENHDLEKALAAVTPLVLGIVLGLGFLLLLVALQAPLAAALGVVTNLLAVGAAFGVGRLIFQDGHGAGFLGFTSQGYVDAWAPVFFFAMIFAISMDYTVFLLSSAKEHWERSHDAARRDGRRTGPLRPGHLRRRRRDGRGLLHLRHFRAAAAQGDGRRAGRGGPARRAAGAVAAAAGAAAAGRPRRLGVTGLADQNPAHRALQSLNRRSYVMGTGRRCGSRLPTRRWCRRPGGARRVGTRFLTWASEYRSGVSCPGTEPKERA